MPRQPQSGFTLVELIAVMVIVALLVSVVALSTGSTVDDRLQVEAKRLALLMEFASEDAVLAGVEIGAIIEADSYRFQRLTAEGWQDFPGRHPLRARVLPKGIVLTRVDEAGKREKQSDDREEKEDAESVPEILFLSTGEITPFELEMGVEGLKAGFVIAAHIDGRVQLMRPGDGDDSEFSAEVFAADVRG